MTIVKEARQQRKAIENKTIDMVCNNQISLPFSITVVVAEMLGLATILSRFNKSNMDLYKILMFIISTLGVARGSLNDLFNDSAIAKAAGFCKATLYNALKHQGIDWAGLSYCIAMKTAEFLFHGKTVWFVVDDSLIKRDCSKFVELLALVYDHNSKTYHTGFTLLVLGLTDGKHFVPISFSLLSSSNKKNVISMASSSKGSTRTINYTTKSGRNRKKAVQHKIDVLIGMLLTAKIALDKAHLQLAGLLIDSWFSAPAQVQRFVEHGIDVITQLKFTKTSYKTVEGKRITIKEEAAKIKQEMKQGHTFGDIAKECVVVLDGFKGKIIFAKNWTESAKRKPYIALFCTNIEYSGEQIRAYYKYRWSIEVMFKRLKSLLALQTGNNTRIFESNIACISIAFIKYSVILLVQKKLKDKGQRMTFNRVIRMFEEERRYTETTKDLAISLETAKEVADDLVQGVQGLVKVCCPLNSQQEELFTALLQLLYVNVLRAKISEAFYNMTPEDQTRLCNYITHGNVVCEF